MAKNYINADAEQKLLDDEGQNNKVIILPVEVAPAANGVSAQCSKCNAVNYSNASVCHQCSGAIAPVEAEMEFANEGQSDAVHIVPVILDLEGNEGRAPSICRIANCDQLAIRRCYLCDAKVCAHHCNMVGVNQQFACNFCHARAAPQQHGRIVIAARRPQPMNRGRAYQRCCMRRLFVRLCIFLILLLLASIYSSNLT